MTPQGTGIRGQADGDVWRRRGMWAGGMVFFLAAAGWPAGAEAAVEIAREGKALVAVAVSNDAIPSEVTAAEELVLYLEKITGAGFRTVDEKQLPAGARAIYVGDTEFARSHGIEVSGLGEEESVLRTVSGNLILSGGRPRGTLYAVYIFLEEVLGCRWYTPWVEKVPRMPTCSVGELRIRTKPAFAVRSQATNLPEREWSAEQKQQWYRYLVRNRMNGPSCTYTIWWKYKAPNVPEMIPGGDGFGGGAPLRCGGPHSFARHFPAEVYFNDHPEWFSMRKGRRVGSNGRDGNHLCLTNRELRGVYIGKLKGLMRDCPYLSLFTVAMNDGGNPTACDCTRCKARAAETSWTDLYIDFLNELADGIRKDFPRNRIWTIAYSFAAKPPLKVVPRDNILITACLLNSNQITLPECAGGRAFRADRLAAWGRVCRNMHVWDYIQHGPPYYFLAPLYFRMREQYRFCRDIGVKGIFGENEIGAKMHMVPEFYPMRLWIFYKLLQNPDHDVLGLVRDFMDGYYGKAGRYFYEYVAMQHERLGLWPHRMVDLRFVREMQRLHDHAEAAAREDAALREDAAVLERVRDARIWADLTTLFFKSKLAGEFVAQGGKAEDYPYKSAVLKERLLRRLKETKSPFWQARRPIPYPRGPRFTLAELTAKYVEQLALGADYAPLPEPFAHMPREKVVDIPGYQLSRVKEAVLVDDADSVFGVASARLTDEELPLGMGVYDHTRGERGETILSRTITADEITGRGYHVYKLGRTTISTRCTFWFTRSWQIQARLEMFHDPMDPGRQWDVYVSAKVDGPAYPHGDPKGRNGAYIDRVILVRVGE